MVAFPIFSTIFLFKNKEQLLDEQFMAKYGPLYSNIRTLIKSSTMNLLWLTFFLLKRATIIVVTLTLSNHLWFQVLFIVIAELIVLSHLSMFRPMASKLLNLMEFLNEFFFLTGCYFLFVFSDLIPSIEDRHYQGEVFRDLLIAVIIINFLLLFLFIGCNGFRKAALYKEKRNKLKQAQNKLEE